jgi:hypothetical protein
VYRNRTPGFGVVNEQDPNAVAVGEGVVGHARLDTGVDVDQQPPHADYEAAYRALAARVTTRLVDHEVIGEDLSGRDQVAGVRRVDVAAG